MTDIDEIFLIEIGRPGLPGTGVSSIEKAQIQSDLATLDTRLDTQRVEDHADIALTQRYDGHAIVWNAPAARWTNRAMAEAVRYIKRDNVNVVEHVDRLNFTGGLTAVEHGTVATQANVSVIYGGTGAAAAAARSDHVHNATIFLEKPFNATGALSSGSRLLTAPDSGWYTPALADGVLYDIEAEAFVNARSSTTGGRFVFRIQIGQGGTEGSVKERTVLVETRAPRLCQVRQVFNGWPGNGGGVRVRVSAEYASGDPVELLDGDVSAACHPRR